jgi:excinuclease UvrABC nuclease subunit
VPVEDFVLEEIASEEQLRQVIAQLEAQMREAAKKFEFERAAALRDRIRALKQGDLGAIFSTAARAQEAATDNAADSTDSTPRDRPALKKK